VGVKYNKKVDFITKEAAIGEDSYFNNVIIKEIITNLKPVYVSMDNQILWKEDNVKVEGYYLNNLNDIKFKFLKKITSNKKNCEILSRLVTGYSYTRTYLYKMLIDSPLCNCGREIQDTNYVFWACPILFNERIKLYGILRDIKLLDSFSIKYLLGNINKKIAVIILKYVKMANAKLNLSL